MTQDLLKAFKAARRVSTPLVAIRTPDPAATMALVLGSFNGNAPAVLRWDIVNGLAGLNDPGSTAATAVAGPDPAISTGNPVEALTAAAKLPDSSVLFLLNAQRFLDNEAVAQAVWNLRDLYKANSRTLVLLCPALTLPAELAGDVLVLDEPLPGEEQLADIVRGTYEAAQLDDPSDEVVTKAVDALAGLAAFPAEQACAMSLTRDGLALDELWERKRQLIEQTPGLSVWRGGESFSQIGGVENAKAFLRRVLTGGQPPRAIVFIDEIEKAMGGQGDTSGVSQSLLGTLLTWMQDNQATGIICIGPPGAAKSALAKAAGNEAGIPTIAFDLTGMKGSLVGESEQRLRSALKVVSAVSQGKTLFIATCNSIAILPPELRRRFSFGTFFFDLPDAVERQAIWGLYLARYGLPEQALPQDEGWTGAEIRQACDLAWRLNCSLVEAATTIVPVSRSAADQIERLRSEANGRFISASYPGVYTQSRTSTRARTISLEG
jgi:hypothetical protein